MFDDVHRVTVALGGRGSGKTHCGVVKVIRHVLDYPGSRVWFVAPDMDRLEEGVIAKFRELCPPELLEEHFVSRKLFTLANGGEIRWRSSDVEAGLRGGERSFGLYDEMAWSPYRQAKRSFSDLRAGLRLKAREFWCPNYWIEGRKSVNVLEAGTERSLIRVEYRPQLVITSTPAIGSFLNELLEVPPADVVVYQLHTEDNAPNLPEDYLEELRAAYAGALYLQEARGELVGVESADYPMFDPKKHVMAPPTEFVRVIGGIDWGYRNDTAIIIGGFTQAGTAFAIEEWGGSHIDLDQLTLKAAELMQKHGVYVYFCDQANPANISYLNRNGVPAVKQAVIQKAYRIAAVVSRFQKTQVGTYRLYINPTMRETIRQLRFAGESYEDPRKLKEVKTGKPGNDYLDALEYMITGGERMIGSPYIPVVARGQKRDEGYRPSLGVPFRFIG